MNELQVYKNELPAAVEDLAKFALVGREKLAAVRAEIRAIDKLKLADDVRGQKIEEAQLIAEAVMDAEVRIGELLRDVPKASGKHENRGKIDIKVEERAAVRFLLHQNKKPAKP